METLTNFIIFASNDFNDLITEISRMTSDKSNSFHPSLFYCTVQEVAYPTQAFITVWKNIR